MRALSIQQPWIFAILELGKDVENRKWSFSAYRGPVLLHASKKCTRADYEDARGFMGRTVAGQPPPLVDLVRGGLVGMARVVGATSGTHTSCWAEQGQLHIELRDVRPLPFVPFVGKLGFFSVPTDALGEHADVYTRTWAELEALGSAA